MTMTTIAWVNAFSREDHKQIIVESLQYCIRERGLNIYAYCIMHNHLHLAANCDEPFQLKDVIRDFKRFTSNQIIAKIQENHDQSNVSMLKVFGTAATHSSKHKNFKLWQVGNHAIELYSNSERFVWQKINYIHQNPVKAGYVEKAEDWKYSSASNYLEEDSILPEVYCLSPMLNRH